MGWSGEKRRDAVKSESCADNECMDDFKDGNGGYKQCQQVDELRAAIRGIQESATKNNVSVAECLLMINRNYGLVWSSIKMGNMPTIKRFVENNCKNMYKICYPEWYKSLNSHSVGDL